MTTFLFTTLPTDDLGLPTRALPIAHELRSRGHRVLFSSPARAPRRLIAEAGFENLTPRHPIYELISCRGRGGWRQLWGQRRWRRYGGISAFLREVWRAWPRRRAPRTAEVWNMDHAGALMGLLDEGFVRASCRAFRDLITDCGAEVVVDFWNPLAVAAARSLARPVVTVVQADAHPGSRGFLWWKKPPPEIPSPAPVLNTVLAEYGLPAVRSLADLSVGDLTLVVGAPETDPLPPDADVTYIGAILWQVAGASLPPSVADAPRDRPLIWVYSGNPRYGGSEDSLDSMVVLQACVGALADLPACVVITTGHHPMPGELLPLPSNCRHEPYVPGLAMAERSDLLIHHGGYGSCQIGLVAGKPAVILPTYSERESNARRMSELGAAVVVPVRLAGRRKSVSTAELRAAVERVLAQPAYADAARRAGETLRTYGGASRAADLIERFALRRRTPQPTDR